MAETKKEAATVTVIVPANVAPHQVEGFADDCERSLKGALHIRPACTLTLTQDEYEHLQNEHPKLFKALIRVEPGPSLADLLANRERNASPAPAAASTAPEHVEVEEDHHS